MRHRAEPKTEDRTQTAVKRPDRRRNRPISDPLETLLRDALLQAADDKALTDWCWALLEGERANG